MQILTIFSLIALSLCCIVGVWLQFRAWKHLKPGIPFYGHKDSLFKKKEEYYTEEGMRYVNMQKKVMYVMLALFALFIISIEVGAPPPPGYE